MRSASDIKKRFIELFNNTPLSVRAPGRINLMGEHMDYNMGISMSAAINREIFFAIAANNSTSHCKIVAMNYEEHFEFNLVDLKPVPQHWSNYITGVVHEIVKSGRNISGFDCVFGGNLPQGAGLSSSAAIACGFAFSLNELFKLKIEKTELAQICLRAEHYFANVKCGLLDQFSSLLGKKDKAIVLDFKSLEFNYIDLDLGDYTFLLFNSNIKHNLARSGHLNERFDSCRRGVEAIQKTKPMVTCLRDAEFQDLNNVKDQLSIIDFNRCRYVMEEMHRFFRARQFLGSKNMYAYGETLFSTHEGMKNLYCISCFELDELIRFAMESPYIIGAKMMGGGFGGCTLNLVEKNKIHLIKTAVEQFYTINTGRQIDIYDVEIVDGISIL